MDREGIEPSGVMLRRSEPNSNRTSSFLSAIAYRVNCNRLRAC